MKVSATAAKNAVEPERIAEAEDIRGRIAIEADTDVEVNLLILVDAVTCARVEQLIVATAGRESAHIFDEQKGAMPRRQRVLVPFSACAASFRCNSIPFSLWKLPTGTTIEELVTSGRSVSIGALGLVHSPATAVDSKAVKDAPTSAINASTRI